MGTLIPTVMVEVIATVSGVIVSVGVPLILAKMNKFGKVYTTVFGIEEVESMSGLVGVVEAHDEEIQELQENQRTLKEGQNELKRRIKDLQKSVEERKNNDGST